MAELVALLAVVCLSIAIAVAVAVWVLRPLDKAAKDRGHAVQFTLGDFFCLFILILFFGRPYGLVTPVHDGGSLAGKDSSDVS